MGGEDDLCQQHLKTGKQVVTDLAEQRKLKCGPLCV